MDERSLRQTTPQRTSPWAVEGLGRGEGGFVLSRVKVQLQENLQGTRRLLEELNHWVTSRITTKRRKSPPAGRRQHRLSRIIRDFTPADYWRGSLGALFVNQGPGLTTRWLLAKRPEQIREIIVSDPSRHLACFLAPL